MVITLKDGSKKEYEEAKSVIDIAYDISEGLARAACAGEVDGEVVDLRTVVDKDCEVNILTAKDEKGLAALRHTASHVLAEAVQKLYPDAKVAIGPSIDTGFYYDFECQPFSREALDEIEKEMKKIIKKGAKIERFTKTREEAIAFFKEKNEPYKVELIEDLPEGEEISFYSQGDWVDLCAGPHLMSTKGVKAFKLLSSSGAYWRGSEKNHMLTRVYGTAYGSKDELKEHLFRNHGFRLQCSGDMVTPSILNAIMCVLDVIFNALLIPRFGVMGAGMGTALACACVSLTMTARCCVHNEKLHLRRTEGFHYDPEILKRAFRIGTPVAVQEIAINSAMVAATMIIAPLGAVSIAANSFAVTAESLCYMPGYGIGSAATTLVGRSVGAGEAKQAKRYGNICTAMGACFMAATGAIMMLICPIVFRVLTPDPSVRTLAAQVLRIELLAEPLFGASIVAAGALRGAGDTFVPSLMNLGSIWIVRLGLAMILVKSLGLHGMWIAMAVELCVRGCLMLYRQRTSKYYDLYKKKTATENV